MGQYLCSEVLHNSPHYLDVLVGQLVSDIGRVAPLVVEFYNGRGIDANAFQFDMACSTSPKRTLQKSTQRPSRWGLD